MLVGAWLAPLAVSRQVEAAAGLKMMNQRKTSNVKWDHLSDAGKYYGTDKAQSSHNFVAVYEAEDFSSSPAARARVRWVLEIGVFFGASLKMWRDWFPSAHVIGIDHFTGVEGYNFGHMKFPHPRAFYESWARGEQGERIHLLEASEKQPAEMRQAIASVEQLLRNTSVAGEPPPPAGAGLELLDVVLDDGSHLSGNQQRNLALLLPLVRPGGTYIVEDAHCSLIGGYDAEPGSARTLLATLERFNATGTWERHKFAGEGHAHPQPVVSAAQAAYIERWAEPPKCVVPPGAQRHRALTCVLRKRTTPRAAGGK